MTATSELLRTAGLEVLGEVGEPAEVFVAWRPFLAVSAVPTVRVPDSLDDPLRAVQKAWQELADDIGLVSEEGEFLVGFPGPEPWLRVRALGVLRLWKLGDNPDEPEFITTSLDGTASIVASTEEYEYLLFARPSPESMLFR